MLKIIFLSLFTFVMFSATAQVQTQVIGDSVFVHGNTGKSELILQNSTDTVNGFLFNKGLGRTEFKRALIKIDDSTYLIGIDTLHLHNTEGSLSATLQNAFDADAIANPQINAHGNDFLIDSVGTFDVFSHDSAGHSEMLNDNFGSGHATFNNGNLSFIVTEKQDDSTVLQLQTAGPTANQSFQIFSTYQLFSGTNNSGNSNSKVVFQSPDTLASPPPYIAAFDGDTLKKVAYPVGSGGVNTIYTADDTITGDRNVSLNGSSLNFIHNGIPFLSINAHTGQEHAVLNPSDGIGHSTITAIASGDYLFGLEANDSTKSVYILGDAGENTIRYAAGTHIFSRIDSAKVVLSNAPILGTTPEYMAAFDGDTLKKYPFTGGGTSGSLQSAFDTDPTANPQINAHSHDFVIDSVGAFTAISYDSTFTNILASVNGGSGHLTFSNDYSSVVITRKQDDSTALQLQTSGPIANQSLQIFSTYQLFSGINNLGNSNSKVVFQSPDTLASPPPYIAAFDGDTLKKVAYQIGGGGGTLQNAYDASVMASDFPTINAHDGFYIIDSVGFYQMFTKSANATTETHQVDDFWYADTYNSSYFASIDEGTNPITKKPSFNLTVGDSISQENSIQLSMDSIVIKSYTGSIHMNPDSSVLIPQNLLWLDNNNALHKGTATNPTVQDVFANSSLNGDISIGGFNSGYGINFNGGTGQGSVKLRGSYYPSLNISTEATSLSSDLRTDGLAFIDGSNGGSKTLLPGAIGGTYTATLPDDSGTLLLNISGIATLSSGTVTVSTTAVKTGAKIFVSVNTPGGTPGFLSAPTGIIINGTSFIINSTSATDSSTINWQIIN